MTDIPLTQASVRQAGATTNGGFWGRTAAMLIKEFIQLRRDRVSFAMIIMIPLV
jgi:ABC-2 type transport system permease protein